MSRFEPVAVRFVRFAREGWIAMHSNVPASSLDGRTDPESPLELDVAVVPNSVAAAAPDLLEACEKAVTMLAIFSQPGKGLPPLADRVGKKLRAAIAKARETPPDSEPAKGEAGS